MRKYSLKTQKVTQGLLLSQFFAVSLQHQNMLVL